MGEEIFAKTDADSEYNQYDDIYRYSLLCSAASGDWSRIAQAIHSHEPVEPVISRSPWVTFLDPDYPACFRKLRYPPWILFYHGDLSLLDRPCAAVVGSRDATMQALRNTTAVVNALKERYVIVSGLARGVDAQAHRAALDKGTVGILGCGIDRVYPRENAALFSAMKKNHLVISEYPWQTTPLPGHFPWRNRLIAAAASVVVVTEAREKAERCIPWTKLSPSRFLSGVCRRISAGKTTAAATGSFIRGRNPL